MGKAVRIIRMEHSAAEPRWRAVTWDDADQARRLLADATVFDRASREDAALRTGMS
jgi:hypothetical protein